MLKFTSVIIIFSFIFLFFNYTSTYSTLIPIQKNMKNKTFSQSKEKQPDIKSDKPSNTDSFRYKFQIETRFADFDMMGHVNNVTYFTYLEIARTKYWSHAISWDWEKTGVVVAQASMDYINPIFIKDKISIYVRTSRIGNSSFDLDYIIVKHLGDTEQICSRGKTVCVAFDYATQKAISIPEAEKNQMIQYEQL
nr:thioesterase family protein [Pedobacter cryoconitis]